MIFRKKKHEETWETFLSPLEGENIFRDKGDFFALPS